MAFVGYAGQRFMRKEDRNGFWGSPWKAITYHFISRIGYISMCYPLFPQASKCLAKKYLTEDIFNQLNGLETSTGFTLEKAISSGIQNPDSAIGIYAGDSESYQVFSPVLEPIIEDYHLLSKTKKHITDLDELHLTNPDPQQKYILSSRIRVARNIREFPFTCNIPLKRRQILEKKIIEALTRLDGNLKGEYHPLAFCKDGGESPNGTLSFKKGDRFQESAGINSDFPQCRGIFSSFDKCFRVWINEEDHMRVISQENSGDLATVFNRLANALKFLEKTLTFERDDKYGYLSSCPTNIGTAMRAGVHIRLEKLNKNRALLTSLTQKHDLQIRGTSGENTQVENAVFDISNRRRLGISEKEIVQTLHKGLVEIIEAESEL